MKEDRAVETVIGTDETRLAGWISSVSEDGLCLCSPGFNRPINLSWIPRS